MNNNISLTLPVILYIMKDNLNLKNVCNNESLNFVVLLAIVFSGQFDPQLPVSLIFLFFMMQYLGKQSRESGEVEGFSPMNENDVHEDHGANYPESLSYEMKGSLSDISPNTPNQYVYNPLLNEEKTVHEPVVQ